MNISKKIYLLLIVVLFFVSATPVLFAQHDARRGINNPFSGEAVGETTAKNAPGDISSNPSYAAIGGEQPVDNVLDVDAMHEVDFTDEASPYKDLKQVLKNDDFAQNEEVWSLRFKEKKQEVNDFDFSRTADWVKFLRKISAYLLRIVIVIAVIALLILLIVIFRKMKKNISGNTAIESFGAEIDPKLSAQDLLSDSIRLFERGNERQAWALCFCAILRAFEKLQIIFPENATEYECLKLVKRSSLSGAHQYDDFSQIVKDRIKITYANMLLPKDNFDKAVNFCNTILLQDQQRDII